MEIRQCLVFNKCFCCSKNFNVSKLIEINANSVVIGDEEIEFADLILDICLISINTTRINYICNECNSQLVYFHIFKREIRKYSNFSEFLPKLKILSKIDEFLDDSEDFPELRVTKRFNEIVISAEKPRITVENSFAEPILQQDLQNEVLIESLESQDETQRYVKLKNVEQDTVEQENFIEEYIDEHIEADQMSFEVGEQSEMSKLAWDDTAIVQDGENSQLLTTPMPDAVSETPQSKRQTTRKYKYPINTNDQLTDEQKTWINSQVQSSSLFRDGQRVYKCSMCETILQMVGTFKKHLRDNHILKSDTQLKTRSSRQELNDEVKESMFEVASEEGSMMIWKCQRCEVSRIFRSQNGLKTHIRYSHIRGQSIDAKFVAKCEVTIQDENGNKKAWMCPECSKVLSRRESLRNHMKLAHPEAFGDSEPSNEPAKKHNSSYYIDDNSLQKLLEKKTSNCSSNICLECSIQFVNGSSRKELSFRIHQECHKILDCFSHFYQLSKCDETKTMFSNDEDLNSFLQSDQMQLIPCDGLTMKVSSKLQDFVCSNQELDTDAWKCGHCGAKFPTENDCNAHVIILHSSKLICPVDYMEFEGSRAISLFNSHCKNKHNEMFPNLVISCTYCSQEFPTFVEKLAHMKKCNEKKFECDHCSKKYFTKTELIRHFRIVSGEIAFVCDICSKSCVSTMDLRLHRTSHSNIKNYACSFPECGKAFKTPAARSSHMETHSNVIFSCLNCPASFKQRAALQRHSRKNFCKGKQSKAQEVFEEFCTDSQMFVVSEVSN